MLEGATPKTISAATGPMTDTTTLPRLSNLEQKILEQLQHKDLLPLQLAARADVNRASVYVTLGRMEHRAYVTSRQEPLPPGAIGLPRRRYAMTGFGQRVLDAWRAAERLFASGDRADDMARQHRFSTTDRPLRVTRRPPSITVDPHGA